MTEVTLFLCHETFRCELGAVVSLRNDESCVTFSFTPPPEEAGCKLIELYYECSIVKLETVDDQGYASGFVGRLVGVMISATWGIEVITPMIPHYTPVWGYEFDPTVSDNATLGAPVRDEKGDPLPAVKPTATQPGVAAADDVTAIARRMKELGLNK